MRAFRAAYGGSVHVFEANTPEQLFSNVVRFFGIPAVKAATLQRAFQTGEGSEDLRFGFLKIEELIGEAHTEPQPTPPVTPEDSGGNFAPEGADEARTLDEMALHLEGVMVDAVRLYLEMEATLLPAPFEREAGPMNARFYLLEQARSRAYLAAYETASARRAELLGQIRTLLHDAEFPSGALLAAEVDGETYVLRWYADGEILLILTHAEWAEANPDTVLA